jgi:hypothetical protein
MLRQTIPCADPECTDLMRLVFENERFIGYRCLLKPNSHNFRYNIDKNLWEKIIINTKPIIGFKESPYEIWCEEELTLR